MKVSIVSKELIVPSSPTPLDLKTYKFSFIDQQIPPYYIPLILYYQPTNTITQSQTTMNLKTSLSRTLTHFYPLAGRLTGDNNSVDCSDQGVEFVVTRVDIDLSDFARNPVIEELNKLVKVDSSYVEEQLAIQVNWFECGGLAVGVSMSHRIGDACSIASFVSRWFALAKRSDQDLTLLSSGQNLGSAVLFPPMNSCEFTRNPKDPTLRVPFERLVTKRFLFSSLVISKMKQKVAKDGCAVRNPTRVEVVSALIWKCATEALGDCRASVAFHSVNFRTKMVPSLQDCQFGNLFQLANAVANRAADMASRVTKLRDSFSKIDSTYVASLMGENGVEIARGNFKEIRKVMIEEEGVGVIKFGSWCRFGLYEGDFGWGKAVWVSSANFSDENSIVLMDSSKDDGIEAWVVMSKDNMHKFEENVELQEFIGSSNGCFDS